MKVSEKSLELNVGAELLARLRGPLNMQKAYLRGLTQREEHRSGADFFARLPDSSRVFAFQFKAPRGPADGPPYTYTLSRQQHNSLRSLAVQDPGAVYYVFPFYVCTDKLVQDVSEFSSRHVVASCGWLRHSRRFRRSADKAGALLPGLSHRKSRIPYEKPCRTRVVP